MSWCNADKEKITGTSNKAKEENKLFVCPRWGWEATNYCFSFSFENIIEMEKLPFGPLPLPQGELRLRFLRLQGNGRTCVRAIGFNPRLPLCKDSLYLTVLVNVLETLVQSWRYNAVCQYINCGLPRAVGSLVLDHVASDFCLKICNLALEANLAHSFLRTSLVPGS